MKGKLANDSFGLWRVRAIRAYASPQVEELQPVIQDHNIELCKRTELEEDHPEYLSVVLAESMVWERVRPCGGAATEKALEHIGEKLCRRYGIGTYAQTKPGKHLEYGRPRLEIVRAHTRTFAATSGCHDRLIAKFDQVWTVLFEPSNHSCWKDQEFAGMLKDELSACHGKQASRTKLEKALGLPVTHEVDDGKARWQATLRR